MAVMARFGIVTSDSAYCRMEVSRLSSSSGSAVIMPATWQLSRSLLSGLLPGTPCPLIPPDELPLSPQELHRLHELHELHELQPDEQQQPPFCLVLYMCLSAAPTIAARASTAITVERFILVPPYRFYLRLLPVFLRLHGRPRASIRLFCTKLPFCEARI